MEAKLTLSQKTTITQLQQLSLKLISLTQQDLTKYLEQQSLENPLMDIKYRDSQISGGGQKNIDNIQTFRPDIYQHLTEQLRLMALSEAVEQAAVILINSLDDRGYLEEDPTDLAAEYTIPQDTFETALQVIQSMDPAGVGARSFQEAFLLQTRQSLQVPPKTETLLQQYYDDFIHGHWDLICEALSITRDELCDIRDFLKTLSLQPAADFMSKEQTYIYPDVRIYIDENGEPAVELLNRLPEISFRNDLYQQYRQTKDSDIRQYIAQAKKNFQELQSALSFRDISLCKVIQTIITVQRPFFHDQLTILPLTQKEIAQKTDLSPSTISRICRGRYLLFLNQAYPFRHFFSQRYTTADIDTSGKIIQMKIAVYIRNENKFKPLSDQDLTDLLHSEGIHVSRRAVNKLRIGLHLGNSRLRRSLYRLKR